MDHSETKLHGVPIVAQTGWAAMARTVRDVDEEKIRDSKDDIDTLLVFAGLFSAVLTAFVGQSYQNLQLNQGATMVELLRQISSQTRGYTVAGTAYLNSTASSSVDDFDAIAVPSPSVTSIRVNVLWFSSLALSLVTASFGILVKQWLREYLAVDPQYTSPQARLRIRHFRYPSLAVWKVFEIAAILPLILQLALGLFLVGLCFFTWTVHAEVGTATTIIVAGWAFLIVLSTLAPIFYPRCPFKTTLLKRVLLLLRRLVHNIGGQSPESTEEEVGIDDSQDLGVIAGVDEVLQDDDFLGTTIRGSLHQMTLRPEQIITFVLGLLRNRLDPETAIELPRHSNVLPDFGRLKKRGWDAVVDIVSDLITEHVEPQLQPREDAWPPWMQDALSILLTYSDHPLTPNGIRALSGCLMWAEARKHTAQVIALFASGKAKSHSLALSHVLRRLRAPLQTMSPTYMFWTLLNIAQYTICKDHDHNDDRLVGFIQHHRDLSPVTLHAIVELLVDCTSRVLSHPGKGSNTSEWTAGSKHAFDALLCCDVPLQAREQVNRLVIALLRREKRIHEALLPVIALREPDRAPERSEDSRIFVSAFASADIHEHRFILNNMSRMCAKYAEHGELPGAHAVAINPVRLCRIAIRMLAPVETGEIERNLQSLWKQMTAAIRRFRSEVQYDEDEQRTLAQDCLLSFGHTHSSTLAEKLHIKEDLFVEIEQLERRMRMPESRPGSSLSARPGSPPTFTGFVSPLPSAPPGSPPPFLRSDKPSQFLHLNSPSSPSYPDGLPSFSRPANFPPFSPPESPPPLELLSPALAQPPFTPPMHEPSQTEPEDHNELSGETTHNFIVSTAVAQAWRDPRSEIFRNTSRFISGFEADADFNPPRDSFTIRRSRSFLSMASEEVSGSGSEIWSNPMRWLVSSPFWPRIAATILSRRGLQNP